MDYKEKWEELKKRLIKLEDYYHKGIMCSLGESIHGEQVCNEVLNLMNKLENN